MDNNNNKAKKINEIRLPATEKESKNETGQKSLNKFPANDNTDKLLSRVLYSTKNKPAQRYNLPTSRKRPFSNKQRRPGSASRKRIHQRQSAPQRQLVPKIMSTRPRFHNMMDVDQMNTLKPQPPNAKKPSRLQSKREKIGNTKELLTVVEEGKNYSGSNNKTLN